MSKINSALLAGLVGMNLSGTTTGRFNAGHPCACKKCDRLRLTPGEVKRGVTVCITCKSREAS